MIAPVAVVTSCNIISFAVTVLHIERVRRLQTFHSFKTDDRNNIFIYAKLSSLTGGFWVVTIVAESTDIEVFRYASILLNGLQGVFVFISFICNQRVLNLYFPRRSKSDDNKSFSQTFTLQTSQTSVSN
ncbi:hypothetical protein Btru_025064 [Bulinus truncatus]|nr:hypothetical protein Btru_025064 [Bulinus truncatus]